VSSTETTCEKVIDGGKRGRGKLTDYFAMHGTVCLKN